MLRSATIVLVMCLSLYFVAITQIHPILSLSENVCRAGEPLLTRPLSCENWRITPRNEGDAFSMNDDVKGIGLVIAIDEENVVFEDRLRDEKGSFLREPGVGVVFLPPVNPEVSEQFCRRVQDSGRKEDCVWLCNGDELLGTLIRVDSRCLLIRTYDVDLVVPRYKVRAVRFGTKRT